MGCVVVFLEPDVVNEPTTDVAKEGPPAGDQHADCECSFVPVLFNESIQLLAKFVGILEGGWGRIIFSLAGRIEWLLIRDGSVSIDG